MTTTGPRDVLELAARYYEDYLWGSEIGSGARVRMERWGLSDETLREFRVGYAPGQTRPFLEHFGQAGVSERELIHAGLASASDRGGTHVRFHARIVFPVRAEAGDVKGFAGLATHLGPSWPLWLSSPETEEVFESASALFGIDKAAAAIRQTGRALVLRDPVQVLALHQDGRAESVAVVQSPITRKHTAQLAAALASPGVDLTRRDGYLGVVAAPPGEAVPDEAFASRLVPSGFTLVQSRLKRGRVRTAVTPAADLDDVVIPTRPWVYAAGGLIGFGVPIVLLLIAGPEGDETGDAAALNFVIVGVATTYLLLAILAARLSARAGQPGPRRMRLPWVRGSGEVQPEGWTYHRIEEIVVGAALVSAAICVVLLMTLGGFLG